MITQSSSGTPSATYDLGWHEKRSTIEAPAEETQGSLKSPQHSSIIFELAASWKVKSPEVTTTLARGMPAGWRVWYVLGFACT